MRGEGRRMGVSFRVTKIGTRFQPRPIITPSEIPEDASAAKEYVDGLRESCFAPMLTGSKPQANTAEKTDESARLLDLDVSFTLNLLPDGFFIGKMNELAALQEVPKSLHPYNRASETLFSAIEMGWLPGDILDDIPSKFVNGSLICEVRDYRKCSSEQGFPLSSMDNSPLIKRIRLRMSLETIVKDIPSMSDDSWTYRDLLEVESRILKAVQPNLVLDPTPLMDRLCQNPVANKLDLGISNLRKKRLRPTPEVTVTSNSQTHGKKIFIDRLPAGINPSIPLMMNPPPHQTVVNSFGKRESEDARLMHLQLANKRSKQDGIMPPLSHQQVASPLDGITGSEMQWKNPMLMPGGCYLNQPGIRFGVKEEKTEMERRYEPEKPRNALQLPEKEGNMLDPLQFAQHMLSKAHFPSQPQHWHVPENKRADSVQKKKSTQSPRVSTGPIAHSPVSSKSGELSSGSMGSAMAAQREKSTSTSVGNALKRKPNPHLKNQPAVSSASAGHSGAPLTTPAATDQAVFDSFSKIESITQRYQLNTKKRSKGENIPLQKLKPPTSQNISFCLANASINDDYNDPVGPMARSLVNGTMNTVKMRVLAFSRQEHFYQGMPVSSTSSMQDCTKVIMRELATDGTVIMHYGPTDESDLQLSHGCPPLVLPNTQYADLLAAQLCRLMERQSYQLKEDNIQPLPSNMINNSEGFGPAFGMLENVGPTIQQRANVASPAGQSATSLSGLSQGFQTVARPMGPVAQPGVQPSFLPGGGASSLPLNTARSGQPAAHLDQLAQQQPQPSPPQQQQPQGQTQPVQMQKSTPMMGVNPLSRLMSQSPGMPMVSNPMVGSKSTHLQMQMMQQQQQRHHHHPQMQPGKPMMSMGSVMGMGAGLRSMPGQMNMGPAAGFGAGLRTVSPVPMTALKLQMAHQSRAAAAAGVYGGTQPNIMGGGQMLANSPAGLSMLGQPLNRGAAMSPLQRATMSSMGPPKIASPANFYLNQQQQQQQQQQLQNHQIMVQQQQQQMGSPMQQVGSPMVVGSPSGMGQQPPVSPQQINNSGVAPASPQLSSQTVGSVTSSPMEQLQGSSKASSVVIHD